jgi:hypothetical protein
VVMLYFHQQVLHGWTIPSVPHTSNDADVFTSRFSPRRQRKKCLKLRAIEETHSVCLII